MDTLGESECTLVDEEVDSWMEDETDVQVDGKLMANTFVEMENEVQG